MRVLIVENEANQRDALIELLAGEGLWVCGVASVDEAMKCLRSSCMDVVLFDLVLPGVSGASALEAISALSGSARIIVTSAALLGQRGEQGSRLDSWESLRRAGADAFIPKPIDFGALMHLLKSFPSRKRSGAHPLVKVGVPPKTTRKVS